MFLRKLAFLTLLLSLILLPSTLYAGKVIYLYQQGVETDVNLAQYVAGSGIEVVSGFAGDQKVMPGPAPEPYPHVHMWEMGMEQLGESSDACDGIRLVNGNMWVPGKKALVLWTIRIPQASMRLPNEFEEDLTLSFWVDWNEDEMWGKNELMIREDINLSEYFPTSEDYLEFEYLSWFWVPLDSDYYVSGGAADYHLRLWVRGAVSYDDPDTSPDGECLFGEVEDYLVTYFNNKEQPDINQK